MKKCCTCKADKSESCFNKSKATKDGLEKRCKECRHSYYLKNQAATYERSRRSISKRKAEVKKYMQQYYLKNAEKHKNKCTQRYIKNRDSIRIWSRNYARERARTNIQFRILRRLRSRINNAIGRGDKAAPTQILLGCTIPELIKHLESKFANGMSWQTYGAKGWHIDHIKPCASFDLTNPEEQRMCFHYTNLQPLWWRENIIKSDNYAPAL